MEAKHRLIRESDGKVLAEALEIADTPATRFWGLLGRSSFPKGRALLISECASVHMFFMRISLDVVFCGTDNKIVAVYPNLKPWRATSYIRDAWYAIEFPVGTLAELGIGLGDEMRVEPLK